MKNLFFTTLTVWTITITATLFIFLKASQEWFLFLDFKHKLNSALSTNHISRISPPDNCSLEKKKALLNLKKNQILSMQSTKENNSPNPSLKKIKAAWEKAEKSFLIKPTAPSLDNSYKELSATWDESNLSPFSASDFKPNRDYASESGVKCQVTWKLFSLAATCIILIIASNQLTLGMTSKLSTAESEVQLHLIAITFTTIATLGLITVYFMSKAIKLDFSTTDLTWESRYYDALITPTKYILNALISFTAYKFAETYFETLKSFNKPKRKLGLRQ